MFKTNIDKTEKKWGRLLAAAECQSYLGAGRNSMERITAAAGARVKVGTRVLYDRAKIDAYLDGLNNNEVQ